MSRKLQINKINFCFLDVSDFERNVRLKKRNTYGADQNMLNWFAWLRMHHQDPQWNPHVNQEDTASIMDFSRLSALKSYEEVAAAKILGTYRSLCTEVYNLSKPNPPEDVYAFYRDHVIKVNGPILGSMCGTGLNQLATLKGDICTSLC